MIVIVDYDMGNIRSVVNAFAYLGITATVSRAPGDIGAADRLVLPGVGSFPEGMERLTRLGLVPLLTRAVQERGTPILGICLGMQLFTEVGYENGEHRGLGWVAGTVRRLTPQDPSLRIPHVGFNTVEYSSMCSLFEGFGPSPDFYFLHSYYVECDPAIVAAWCDYGGRFPASVNHRNIFGTQFHPEKSQITGLQLLRNFAALPLEGTGPAAVGRRAATGA